MEIKGRIAVFLSGRGSNFMSILESSRKLDSNFTVSLVVTDNKDSLGYKRALEEKIPAIALTANQFPSKTIFEEKICHYLYNHKIELICLAGYMKLIGKTLLSRFEGKIMNIHPSLLPSFSGLSPQQQALQRGVKVSGCTVHFVDQGMDTGPIILQKAVPVLEDDNEETLSTRILNEEHLLYPQAITLFFAGRLTLLTRTVKIRL